MSGALAERDFAHKIEKVGFSEPIVLQRRPFSIDDVARYPLFTPDLIELMHELLTPEQQAEVATSITLVATRPG